MSKRLSGQSNTLLNYFASPKSKVLKQNDNNPKSQLTEENGRDNGHEDNEIIQPKKRKKIAIIDSESDDEGNNNTKCSTPKKKKSSKSKTSPNVSTPKQSLKQFAIDKTSENNIEKNGDQSISTDSETKRQAVAVTDVHSNWAHNHLEWLQPDKIRDINKKRPDDPEYDPRTLYVPKEFLDEQTPGMRQWWLLKSTHMDSVMFFKVGKFYELYHMDAVVGAKELGFSYMKVKENNFAHSGFPESAYHKMANALIEKGFKVARIEQTETPEMMAERCKKQKKCTKFDKIVNREICQITAKGTVVYNAQLPDAMHSLPCYLFAISEKEISPNLIRIGICFVDTSIGTFYLGEFDDDKYFSVLLSVLSENTPGLILIEKRKISPKLKEILSTYYQDVRKDNLIPEKEFYSAAKTIERLMNGNYFLDKDDKLCLPELIKNMIDGYNPKPEYELALKSLGACVWYLTDSKLDLQVISMNKFELYQPTNTKTEAIKNYMILDSITINNLSLLGGQGSLQKTIDFCQTAFGKRLLQQWICRPLCHISSLIERQQAVEEIYKNLELLQSTQSILKKLPDLERQVAKIHSYGNRFFAKDHPDSRAVFYEASTYSKRRIIDLLKTLQGFEQAQEISALFKDCNSSLLRKLTQYQPVGEYNDLTESINFFKNAFDQEQAQIDGKIIPKAGVDENFDNAESRINEIKNDLNQYLIELQQFFGCKVTYFGSDKKRYQIDVPEKFTKKVTAEFQLESAKNGAKACKRYSTPRSRQLLADMLKAESERSKIIQDLNRRIFEKFSERQQQWECVIKCLAKLDVLCSLAEYARTYSQDICLPKIEPMSDEAKIIIENGRHPCVANVDSFVPNDIKLGIVEYPHVLLLTGPNMGGKSTLMRQVAIITIMAQIGSYVPASSCCLNLVDRIFTRLGAHDDIIQGQSTFLVELSEASLILQHATKYSLVLLDELGRGTSTHDGNAIATAYVKQLTEIKCRTLFSTHYHTLVDYFINREDIQLGHMACMVENDEDPTDESVTFLYKMAKGRCPKSYGFNVAKLAGLRHEIVARARQVAKQLEEESRRLSIFNKLFSCDVTAARNLISSVDF